MIIEKKIIWVYNVPVNKSSDHNEYITHDVIFYSNITNILKIRDECNVAKPLKSVLNY